MPNYLLSGLRPWYSPGMDAAARPPWTVLVYTSASRDLEAAVRASVDELADRFQGAPVVVQEGWGGQARRLLLQGAGPTAQGELAQVDMSRPQCLRDFLTWSMGKFPSQHYALVLGGHGAGFPGAITNSDRTAMMRLPELAEAIGSAPQRPDLTVFNTCLMAQAEVAEQLAPVTDTLVASQGKLLGLGLPLAAWSQRLHATVSGPQAADLLVYESAREPGRSPRVASIDLQRWPQMRDQAEKLAQQVLAHPQAVPLLRQSLTACTPPWPRAAERPLSDMLDLGDVARSWAGDVRLPDGLRTAARDTQQQLARCVHSGDPAGSGLSLFLPARPLSQLGSLGAQARTLYEATRWSEKTSWGAALELLMGS